MRWTVDAPIQGFHCYIICMNSTEEMTQCSGFKDFAEKIAGCYSVNF